MDVYEEHQHPEKSLTCLSAQIEEKPEKMLQEENWQLIRELCDRLNSTLEPGGEQQHGGAFLKPLSLPSCAFLPFLPLNSQTLDFKYHSRTSRLLGKC